MSSLFRHLREKQKKKKKKRKKNKELELNCFGCIFRIKKKKKSNLKRIQDENC